jgi:hypothetical protein
MTIRLLAALLLCVLVPSARAQETGKGELWMHQTAWDYYEQFRRDQGRAYFAVSTNGISAGYSYCPGLRCLPLDGKNQAISACQRDDSGLPGTCYIFANSSRILWQGEVHVLSDDEFMARLYGPDSIQESLKGYVEHVAGLSEGSPSDLLPSAKVWKRADFRFAPADLAPAGDECRYAFDELYQANVGRNLFLLDAEGRHCAYSTGFPAAQEAEAFERALAACERLAGTAGKPCYVYAAGSELLAGRSKL